MLDDLFLLRLLASTDATRSRVRDDLIASFFVDQGTGRQAFAETVDRTAAAGFVEFSGKRKGRLELTEAGRARVRSVFQIAEAVLDEHHGWRWWRDRYAVPRALGVKSLPTTEAFRAAVLRRLYLPELPASLPVTSLAATVDLLLVKRLGATGGRVADFRSAVLREWIAEKPPAPTCGVQPSPHLPEELSTFAARVRTAARRCESGRFGENKVFISHVWKTLLASGGAPAAEERAFKEKLVRANTAGLLRLSRADLAGAHDANDVQASETVYLGESFHFLRLD